MIERTTKLRWRRLLRRRRKQASEFGTSTEQGLEKHLIKRLVRLPGIRRFLFGWVGLLVVLSIGLVFQARAVNSKYQSLQARSGGTYTEGLTGTFTNANPLFASNSVDSSVSRLVFSGLIKYDQENKLVGDLAESWTVGPNERVYTFKLKPDLQWHDGKPLTAQDVAFTYKTIQNPEVKSYLSPSFQNVKVEATDPQTVVFTLPNSLSSFIYSLTIGIIPEHILKDVSANQMRSNTFNNVNPIGSGPFRFNQVEVAGDTPNERQERIALNANEHYHFGRPKLDNFTFRTYSDETALIKAYTDNEVTGMIGPSSLPEELNGKSGTAEFSVPLTGETLVFFKTTQEVLQDVAVRRALVLAANKQEIITKLGYPLSLADEPFLKEVNGYNSQYRQITGKPDEAKKALDAAGWIVDPKTGIRAKDGKKLSFRLYSQSSGEYSTVAGVLQKQWRDIGVDMQVELQSDQDLQTTLSLHNYDALLYGISLGPDPDVFAYWHSSQGDPRSSTRLNFSEYKSTAADLALEAGRTRSDTRLRSVKYQPFLEAFQKDAPALTLYQPRLFYIAHTPFYGLNSTSANIAADRFTNVQNWQIREGLAR